MLAVLLVGGGRHRPFLAARDGFRRVHKATNLRGRAHIPGTNDRQGRHRTEVPRLRPWLPIRLRGLSRLVPALGNQAASLRGYRPTRQHCRGRTIHLDDEMPAGRLAAGPYRRESFRRELVCIAEWYNAFRPISGLAARRPTKVYRRRISGIRRPDSSLVRVGRGLAVRTAVGAGRGTPGGGWNWRSRSIAAASICRSWRCSAREAARPTPSASTALFLRACVAAISLSMVICQRTVRRGIVVARRRLSHLLDPPSISSPSAVFASPPHGLSKVGGPTHQARSSRSCWPSRLRWPRVR